MTEKDIQYLKDAINWLSQKAVATNKTESETLWNYTHNSFELLDGLNPSDSTECFKTPVVGQSEQFYCSNRDNCGVKKGRICYKENCEDWSERK